MSDALTNPFIGSWHYRSLFNEAGAQADWNKLQFGEGTLVFAAAPMGLVAGHIGGPGWNLNLRGNLTYGNPNQARFQGTGVVSGEEWVYDYLGWLVPQWPNGVSQVPAIVGTVVRTVPHSSGTPGGVSPAGVVASFYAVRMPTPG